MTNNRAFFHDLRDAQHCVLSIAVFSLVSLVFSGYGAVVAQTTNTSTEVDKTNEPSVQTVVDHTQPSSGPVGLEFLIDGGNPQNLAQLRAMQDHVREISDRVKEATVNINMGMGQGTGVMVSSDGIVLTAAHVIARPRQIALITFSDGSQAQARTLGVEAGMDSGMLKIFKLIEQGDADNELETEDMPEEQGKPQSPESKKADQTEDGSTDTPQEESGNGSSDRDSAEDSAPALPLEKSQFTEKEVDVVAAAFDESDLPFFPYLDMGVSEQLKDGQWVVAVGHPGGLNENRGMVVRVGRIINRHDTLIRTDCTLVGGDSGGPLVDMGGNLIAIHSRMGSRLQDNLHVPIDVFSDTWDLLISGYKIGESGKLGISINPRSTLVSGLIKNGPAARGGVQVGDIITMIGDNEVNQRSDIRKALSTRYPYEKVSVTVRRGSNEVELVVMLGEASPEPGTRRDR